MPGETLEATRLSDLAPHDAPVNLQRPGIGGPLTNFVSG